MLLACKSGGNKTKAAYVFHKCVWRDGTWWVRHSEGDTGDVGVWRRSTSLYYYIILNNFTDKYYFPNSSI